MDDFQYLIGSGVFALVAAVVAVVIFGLVGAYLAARRGRDETDPSTPGRLTSVLYLTLPLVAFALVPLVLVALPRGTGFETSLPVLLAGGVVLLLLTLAGMTVVFKQLGLVDQKEALGLPQGTVRAVIALALILIFAIISIYIYSRSVFVTVDRIPDLTREQVDQIPVREIVSVSAQPTASPTPVPTATPLPTATPAGATPEPSPAPTATPDNRPRFTVSKIRAGSQTGEDIGKQLITTISTLVVAISAFYFGSNSVMSAQAALAGGIQYEILIHGPLLRKPKRKGPDGWESETIIVLTVPRGLAIKESVDGDGPATLTRTEDEKFTYAPSANAKEKVTLRFALEAKPEVSKEVTVELPREKPAEPAAPVEPVKPAVPVAPAGPAGPAVPVAPAGPAGPTTPAAPVGPAPSAGSRSQAVRSETPSERKDEGQSGSGPVSAIG